MLIHAFQKINYKRLQERNKVRLNPATIVLILIGRCKECIFGRWQSQSLGYYPHLCQRSPKKALMCETMSTDFINTLHNSNLTVDFTAKGNVGGSCTYFMIQFPRPRSLLWWRLLLEWTVHENDMLYERFHIDDCLSGREEIFRIFVSSDALWFLVFQSQVTYVKELVGRSESSLNTHVNSRPIRVLRVMLKVRIEIVNILATFVERRWERHVNSASWYKILDWIARVCTKSKEVLDCRILKTWLIAENNEILCHRYIVYFLRFLRRLLTPK